MRSIRAATFTRDGVAEKTVPIHETNQIRILLVRKSKDRSHIRIEIEVTLPEELSELDTSFNANVPFSPHQPALRMSLEDLVTLFQYLIDLQKAGFQLDFFSTEGVWVASYTFDKEPNKALFTKFKPPKTRIN